MKKIHALQIHKKSKMVNKMANWLIIQHKIKYKRAKRRSLDKTRHIETAPYNYDLCPSTLVICSPNKF